MWEWASGWEKCIQDGGYKGRQVDAISKKKHGETGTIWCQLLPRQGPIHTGWASTDTHAGGVLLNPIDTNAEEAVFLNPTNTNDGQGQVLLNDTYTIVQGGRVFI